MTKATTMAAMRTYYSLLSFVQENEDLTRLQYLCLLYTSCEGEQPEEEDPRPVSQKQEEKDFTHSLGALPLL